MCLFTSFHLKALSGSHAHDCQLGYRIAAEWQSGNVDITSPCLTTLTSSAFMLQPAVWCKWAKTGSCQAAITLAACMLSGTLTETGVSCTT